MSNLKTISLFIGGIALGGVITSGIFISQQKKQSVDISGAVGVPLFSVDGKTYTTNNLPGDAAMEYYTLENNIYNAKKEFAAQVATRVALAKDAAKPVDSTSLPKMNEVLAVAPVTEAEAKQTYDRILQQMGPSVFGGQSFDTIKTQLEMKLSQQKQMQAVTNKSQELETKGRVQILLSKPPAPTVKLNLDGYPTQGNANASSTLVEVADYLCPHCRETEGVMEKIRKDFSSQIKFVHVSFPLNPEGLSGALARGAYCAQKQGEDSFWKYHKFAFQVPFDKVQLKPGEDAQKTFNNDAVDVAKNAGLNVTAFTACLSSADASNYLKKVQNDFNSSNGFQGTPAFYLNDKILEMAPQQIESTLRTALAK